MFRWGASGHLSGDRRAPLRRSACTIARVFRFHDGSEKPGRYRGVGSFEQQTVATEAAVRNEPECFCAVYVVHACFVPPLSSGTACAAAKFAVHCVPYVPTSAHVCRQHVRCGEHHLRPGQLL
eukprot:4988501-Pleurochrysis_carterae.AAC.2